MNLKFIKLTLIFLVPFQSVFAQKTAQVDSLLHSVHYSYDVMLDGRQKLGFVKISYFDSSQILVQQERVHFSIDTLRYLKVTPQRNAEGKPQRFETNLPRSSYYYYEYDPLSKQGSYYTESFPSPSGKGNYKKEETRFKSYDHSEKRLWVKQYDADRQMMLETESSYDEKGDIIKTFTRDYEYQPPITHFEDVQRNAAGMIVFWESYEEDSDGRKKVREMSCQYKNDSILVLSSGYLHNNWNEVANTFNKKSGKLEKTVKTFGYRQDDGTVKRNHRHETTYKNGKPYRTQEYEYNKKTRLHSFTYTDSSETETITQKDMPTEVLQTITYKDANGNLLDLTKIKNAAPTDKMTYTYYDNGKLRTAIEIEYHKSGDIERFTEYDSVGNPLRKYLKMGGKLIKEELFEYVRRK